MSESGNAVPPTICYSWKPSTTGRKRVWRPTKKGPSRDARPSTCLQPYGCP